MIIAVDFDGTIVQHDYPRIGAEVPEAIDTLKEWVKMGHKLILWTMRSGKELQEACDFLKDRGVVLWGVNGNPDQSSWSTSPKAYASLYVDDAALGCPLVATEEYGRPVVDWAKIRKVTAPCTENLRLLTTDPHYSEADK